MMERNPGAKTSSSEPRATRVETASAQEEFGHGSTKVLGQYRGRGWGQ